MGMVTCRVAHPMPFTLGYIPFVILLCHILRADGFTGTLLSPLIAKRSSPWSAGTCAPKATSQGGDSMNPSRIRDETGVSPSRIDFLRAMGRMGLIFIFGPSECVLGEDVGGPEKSPTVGKITKDGVKYFDYRVGEGGSPRWGQDCIVRFTMYGRSSPDKLVKIHSSDDNEETYLFKHGNGRQIKGMEVGLHTMRVGGKRRIIIPQQLGYSVQGLGPYPAQPRKRDKLVKVLQSFEETGRGELVMDIELLEVFDDEADQGYYEDETVSPEDVQAIIAETSRFSDGMPLEKLPGQLAAPMIDE